MLVSGFLTCLLTLMPERAATIVACTLPVVMLAVWLFMLLNQETHDDLPATLPECPLRIIRPFFRTRFAFLERGHRLVGETVYKFKLLQHTVVAISGGQGRRDFFTSRDLDLHAGFNALLGTIPMLPGVTTELDPSTTAIIYRRLASVQSSASLERLITKIVEDIREVMDTWGGSGTLCPFESIPEITFQTNLRCLAPSELADDPVVASRLRELYDVLEMSTSPASVLLPWFPSPSNVKKIIATKKIHDIISEAVEARMKGHILPQDDTLQLLLDSGDDRMVIIGFIMGLLVAGARSTGTTASWLVTFLAGHPQWKAGAIAELRHLLACHHSPHLDSSRSTAAALSSISLSAWESQTPILDGLIRETLRLAQPYTALRQNTSASDVRIAGKVVPPGAFAVYPFADVHLSPELYPDPWRFNPGRPESKMPLSWVGWGAGKTVCLGQRLARLELKLIAAMFLLNFELDAVDEHGRAMKELPRPDWSDMLHCKPAGASCHLRYRRTSG